MHSPIFILVGMLRAQVLGLAAHDNALLVMADSGQSQTRLLLDCGAGVLDGLPFPDVASIDHLLFSHFHMDHISGFDAFFRINFDRIDRQNHIWGPVGSIKILGHRFAGYLWNLKSELRGVWHVHEIDGDSVRSARFEAREGFAVAHDEGEIQLAGRPFISTPEVEVQALALSHHGVSLGYILREPERLTVNKEALQRSGLKSGAWLAALKAGANGMLDVHGQLHDADELRSALLRPVSSESLAYLTDFLLSDAELTRLAPQLRGLSTLYAEAQYAPEDLERATRHHHTTVTQVAQLAQRAGVKQLELLHLSRRYEQSDWDRWLTEARQIFPATSYPETWF